MWRYWVVAGVLLSQTMLFHSLYKDEAIPPLPALATLPESLGRWELAEEDELRSEVEKILQPDLFLDRTYQNGPYPANLMIAYFRTQRKGRLPHSPKNCLPSAGWLPAWHRSTELTLPGIKDPVPVNHYLIAKGREKMMVYYLYVSQNRMVASEYAARIFLTLDSLRHNRTDTMLVRFIVPVQGEEDVALRHLNDFTREVLPRLSQIYQVDPGRLETQLLGKSL